MITVVSSGNIWIGKQQMVRKVEPWHLKALNKDLERVSLDS